MKKVLAVSRWPGGGIRTWFRYVYRDPLFADVDLTLVLPSLPATDAVEADLAGLPVRVQRVGASAREFLTGAMRAVLSFDGDLVHSHGFSAASIVAVPCRIRSVAHLVTQHDVILEDQYVDLSGRLQRFWLGRSLAGSTAIHSVSAAAARNLRQQFPALADRTDRLTTIDNGIEAERFLAAEPAAIRQELGLKGSDFMIGFFGRFMKQKGFKNLIEAIAVLREGLADGRRPVVVAVGDGGFRSQEERMIESLGLAGHFRFTGFVPNVAGIMKAMDVVAMPSLWEACGLVAMEALVAGAPLICSDCEALVDISRGSPAMVFPKGESDALARALAAAADGDRRADAAAYAARAAQRFDARITARDMRALYERLCS